MAGVAVLLSSYDGSRYIGAQIASILDQLPDDGLLMIRDDGSRDGTLAAIRRFRDPRLRLLEAGPNLGHVKSFFRLLEAAPESDTFMFADQDDIWLPGKVARAVTALSAHGPGPVLYACRPQPVDSDLNPLPDTYGWPRGPSFRNALVENIVSGCTAAINGAARARILAMRPDDSEVRFHDWWMYLVISAFGKVVLDDERLILWRRHGEATTLKASGLKLFAEAVFEQESWLTKLNRQNLAFYRLAANELAAADREFMTRHADLGKPIAFATSPYQLRQTPKWEFLLRAAVVLHAVLPWGSRLKPYAPQR